MNNKPIDKSKKSNVKCENCIHFECCCDWVSSEDLKALSTSENCATYKDKSLFVELPCKVWETVYRITELHNGKSIIVEGKALEFTITHEAPENDKYRFYFWANPDDTFTNRMYSLWCEFAEFSKTVFLDRAEAQAKLKEIGNGT